MLCRFRMNLSLSLVLVCVCVFLDKYDNFYFIRDDLGHLLSHDSQNNRLSNTISGSRTTKSYSIVGMSFVDIQSHLDMRLSTGMFFLLFFYK